MVGETQRRSSRDFIPTPSVVDGVSRNITNLLTHRRFVYRTTDRVSFVGPLQTTNLLRLGRLGFHKRERERESRQVNRGRDGVSTETGGRGGAGTRES